MYDNGNLAKGRIKLRRKRQQTGTENIPKFKEIVRTDEETKKSPKINWQRTVKLNSRIKESKSTRTSSLLTIQADALKLLSTSKQLPEQQRKLESRRKFRSVGTVASTCVDAAKTAIVAKQSRRTLITRPAHDTFCESSLSDDNASSDSAKLKATKKTQKKKKKKKQQPRRLAPMNREIKRASSAKMQLLRNNL